MMKFIYLLFIFLIQVSFSYEHPVLPMKMEKNDPTIKKILTTRSLLIQKLKENQKQELITIIEHSDQEFVGIQWISEYERLLAYIVSGSSIKITSDQSLLELLWYSKTNYYTHIPIPNSLCQPIKKSIQHYSMDATVQLEHYLWQELEFLSNNKQLPSEIIWIKNNSKCNNTSHNTDTNRKITSKKIKSFNSKFPNSRFISERLKKHIDHNLYWSGNGLLLSLGYVNTQFYDNTSQIISDGHSFGFGITIHFPLIVTGVTLNIKNFNLKKNYTFKDSTFTEGNDAEFSQINWIIGYPIKPIKKLAIIPYIGSSLATFKGKIQPHDNAERDKYEVKSYGYPIGLLVDYSLYSTTESRNMGIGFGYGIRGGLQYTYTNLSSLDSKFGDNAWTARLELTFGFHGVNKK